MRRYRSAAIVLGRTNFGEADRIVTFLTEQQGLVSAMVKGARKQGNKLAGGIELFSVCDITFLEGKGELDHVISSRLQEHFQHIVSDYARVELGYEAIKQVARAARQFTEPGLYVLLEDTLRALNDSHLSVELVESWWRLNLLALLGQQPNLTHDVNNRKLTDGTNYTLLPDDGAFRTDERGVVTPEQIKAWRVLLRAPAAKVAAIKGVEEQLQQSLSTLRHLFEYQFG
jgi:DNA repair protein RecO (recombination protein O)